MQILSTSIEEAYDRGTRWSFPRYNPGDFPCVPIRIPVFTDALSRGFNGRLQVDSLWKCGFGTADVYDCQVRYSEMQQMDKAGQVNKQLTNTCRTLRISDDDFQKIQSLVYEKAGINLHDGKKSLVQSRLSKIIRRKGLEGFREYYNLIVRDQSGNHLVELLDAITTNHTYFFREDAHLQWLSDTILPDILRLPDVQRDGEVRIWSAGCSTGEEPYTLAIHILERCNFPARYRLKVLATDLSTKVIRIADRGEYPEERLQQVPASIRQRYFNRVRTEEGTSYYRVNKEVRNQITFRKFNLLSPFPFRKGFDVIFCRNVMIYFDREVQQRVVSKFVQAIKPGGYLVVGHSESLSGVEHPLKYIGPTVYKKSSAD